MSTILRRAAKTACNVSRSRAISTSPISRKDLVQDLYLKEIKAYKPAPVAKDAHVGVVKPFASPSVPKPPTLPSDLASELSAYDSSEPTIATETKAPSTTGEVEIAGGADAYLNFLEEDLPKPEEHHH